MRPALSSNHFPMRSKAPPTSLPTRSAIGPKVSQSHAPTCLAVSRSLPKGPLAFSHSPPNPSSPTFRAANRLAKAVAASPSKVRMPPVAAPRPVNAGTMQTPPESSTLLASASMSAADWKKPSSSRSHCTTAPPTNTLPSSAYSLSFRCAQGVDTRPCADCTTRPPVCSSMKQPVP